MAISIDDVKAPAGDLDRLVLFPDESAPVFDARLEAYIADAYVRATDGELDADDADEFAKEWTHYRAYRAADQVRNATPSSATLPEGGAFSFQSGQLTYFGKLAADHLAAAEAILSPEVASGWGSAVVVRGS